MAYLSNPGSQENELSRLRAQNASLAEELAQCQADKEFVWSLWKRLQVANPDITQAVGVVIQREREKAEAKDRKVLQILQVKDDKIDELQKVLADQSRELSVIVARKIELQGEASRYQMDNKELTEKLETMELKVQKCTQKEQTTDTTIQRIEEEKQAIKTKLDDVQRERDQFQLRKTNADTKIQSLESEVNELSKNYEKVTKEHEEAKALIQKYECQLTELQKDVTHKNRELEAVRRELSDLWQTHQQTTEHAGQQAELIRQLQSLHQDTQKMLTNQEDAYTMENKSLQQMYTDLSARYQGLKTTEADLRQHILDYRQQVANQDQMIADLRKQINETSSLDTSKSVATQASLDPEDKDPQGGDARLSLRLDGLQTEVRLLQDKLKDKNRVIQSLQQQEDLSFVEHGTFCTPPRSSSTPSRSRKRSRSPSPPAQKSADVKALKRKLKNTERKLEDTRSHMRIKDEELEEMRTAHQRRLERLHSLQTNYKLIKKQLQTMEEEQGQPKRKKKLRRSDPKSLQKEDSDKVWNELTYFKNENKNLMVEKMNLQEEVDVLRVQAARDRATVHELRACLEQEREELQFVMENQDHAHRQQSEESDYQASVQAEGLQRQLQQQVARVQQLGLLVKELEHTRDQVTGERRSLMSEMNEAKQAEAERRIEIADLKQDLHRAQRELRRRKQKSQKSRLKSSMVKQYQRVLNKSISDMGKLFDNFETEGWEDLTEDTGDEATGDSTTTLQTSQSLGQVIADSALYAEGEAAEDGSPRGEYQAIPDTANTAGGGATNTRSPGVVMPTRRQVGSIKGHIRRLANKLDSPKRDPGHSRKPAVCQRSVATSPLIFQQPSVVSKKAAVGSSIGSRQLSALRQRISSLQQQVRILKLSKASCNKTQTQQKMMIDQLQTDYTLANQRLQNARLTIQRLNADIERLKEEKAALEMTSDLNSSNQTTSTQTTQATSHNEEEWASLQARLKNASSELTSQLNIMKQLRTDKQALETRVDTMQERTSHLERDLAQKRSLLEDLRLKLKLSQENANSDNKAVEELEKKLKNLSETSTRHKVQCESLRQHLAAVNKEKHEHQETVMRLTSEVERKSRQVTDLQRRCSELQRTVSEIEATAQEQLHGLAYQSEAAIDAAHSNLSLSKSQLEEYHKFVQILSSEIVNNMRQARSMLEWQKHAKAQVQGDNHDSSLAKAKKVACSTLNMSMQELEEFMSTDGTPEPQTHKNEEEERKDKRWQKKCWKVVEKKNDFALSLVRLFMDKVEERSQLAAQMSTV